MPAKQSTPRHRGKSQKHNQESLSSIKRLIKKYPNRRLYDTATSHYITLDNLLHMVKEGVDFKVLDAKTGEDITRLVLAQIIIDQEARGQSAFPVKFLRQIIQQYGDQWQPFLPKYLEESMDAFVIGQSEIHQMFRQQWEKWLGKTWPNAGQPQTLDSLSQNPMPQGFSPRSWFDQNRQWWQNLLNQDDNVQASGLKRGKPNPASADPASPRPDPSYQELEEKIKMLEQALDRVTQKLKQAKP